MFNWFKGVKTVEMETVPVEEENIEKPKWLVCHRNGSDNWWEVSEVEGLYYDIDKTGSLVLLNEPSSDITAIFAPGSWQYAIGLNEYDRQQEVKRQRREEADKKAAEVVYGS